MRCPYFPRSGSQICELWSPGQNPTDQWTNNELPGDIISIKGNKSCGKNRNSNINGVQDFLLRMTLSTIKACFSKIARDKGNNQHLFLLLSCKLLFLTAILTAFWQLGVYRNFLLDGQENPTSSYHLKPLNPCWRGPTVARHAFFQQHHFSHEESTPWPLSDDPAHNHTARSLLQPP